ncbi:MAG: class I SAM-dependent methyltransferase [Bacteroidetes bacterium]|nr:MAG: class I SAM-dependent methyltransferase [Bacteroidota bacterium]
MDNREGYDLWARRYDEMPNPTRDAEAAMLRQMLAARSFGAVLELGCGTAKNTGWLAERASRVVATDFSEGMLARARQKVTAPHVSFVQMDLRLPWPFPDNGFELVTCSLVLEHVADLTHVFAEAARVLRQGGLLYVGEFHPFRQYLGKKARFETEQGITELECHVHHVSEYLECARKAGLHLVALREAFDERPDKPPRVLAMVWCKE